MVEKLDLVDENDNVVKVVERKGDWLNLIKQDLFSRSVGIVLLNSKNEIFVHQRSFDKEFNPGFYDSAFGGNVISNETYAEAAHRELLEESGINEKPIFLKKDKRFMPYNTFISYYYVVSNKEVKLDHESINGKFMSIDELRKFMIKNSFCNESFEIINELIKNNIINTKPK